MKLLRIDSSISAQRSVSRAITDAIVANLRVAHPGIAVVERDLAADPLPHLTLDILADVAANADLAEFEAADIVVIGAGMYNFTIPSQLKAWIDRLVIPGRTFRYTQQGPVPLLEAKHIVIALARGSLYTPTAPFAAIEHAESYLRAVFGFIGLKDPVVITADGVAIDEATRTAALDAALGAARALELSA